MAEFLSPGVFIEEIASGQTAILGVSTSTYATAGWTERGETDKAILVTSLPDFFRKFGSYWSKSDAPLGITAFFKNGGSRAYFVRTVPDDAVAASGNLSINWIINAISKGTWGNKVRLVVRGNDNFLNYTTATYSRFDVDVQEESTDGAGDWSTTESYEAVSLDDTEDQDYFPDVLNDELNGSGTVRVSLGTGGIPSAFDSTEVTAEVLGTGTGSQSTYSMTLAQPPVAPFTVKVKVDGNIEAVDNGRGVFELADTASGATAVSGTVDYTTGDVVIDILPPPVLSASLTIDYYQAGVSELSVELTGGLDGTSVGRAQVTSPALEADYRGIYAFNKIDEILNLGLMDFAGNVTVATDLLAFAETRQGTFVILDSPRGADAQDIKNYKLVTLGSQSDKGALYWPGIKIADPLKNDRPRVVSNTGHIAGIYARTDNNRNVAKAPAGQIDGQLAFALGLEFEVTKGDRDTVYPANVNPLRADSIVGKAVWGVRTLARSGDFTLVTTRRLFLFLEYSTFLQTHDLVFEPLTEDLFASVTLRMTSFLSNLTQDGYFASRVPAEAFRVICDTTNNTPETIQARQLIVDVDVSVAIPAEFVRFRFRPQFQVISA
jgi:phage tail sheath protein FI